METVRYDFDTWVDHYEVSYTEETDTLGHYKKRTKKFDTLDECHAFFAKMRDKGLMHDFYVRQVNTVIFF